jgi:hypothetical protein
VKRFGIELLLKSLFEYGMVSDEEGREVKYEKWKAMIAS